MEHLAQVYFARDTLSQISSPIEKARIRATKLQEVTALRHSLIHSRILLDGGYVLPNASLHAEVDALLWRLERHLADQVEKS